jgi:hypothetical protein
MAVSAPDHTSARRHPAITHHAASFQEERSSRVANFAGDIDRTFWLSGNTDLSGISMPSSRSEPYG